MATAHARQRLTKHQLKEDAFTTGIFRAKEWAEQNSRLLLSVVGGVLAVILIVWGVNRYFTGQKEEAQALFGVGGVELRANNLPGAIINFQKVVDEHGGSDVAGLACFQLAAAHFRQRNFDQARMYYQKYIDDYGDDPMLVASAWGGMASIDEQSNDPGAAADKNFRAAEFNPKSASAAEFLRHALRCAIAANDSGKAAKALELLEKNAPDERMINIARQTMIEHGLLAPK
ncbi:MAG: tetratricopeptide repeat protein [Candidatus Zixiibacteriota bacterium]